MTLSVYRVDATLIKVNAEMTILYRPVGPKELALIAVSGLIEVIGEYKEGTERAK